MPTKDFPPPSLRSFKSLVFKAYCLNFNKLVVEVFSYAVFSLTYTPWGNTLMLLLINVMLLIDTGRLLEENGKVRNITEVSTSFAFYVFCILFIWAFSYGQAKAIQIRYLGRRNGSLRASSPIWASETSLLPLAPRSRVLARLASLAQIGELACRLEKRRQTLCFKKYRDTWGRGLKRPQKSCCHIFFTRFPIV